MVQCSQEIDSAAELCCGVQVLVGCATVRGWSQLREIAHVLEKLHLEKSEEPLEQAQLRPWCVLTVVQAGRLSEMARVEPRLPHGKIRPRASECEFPHPTSAWSPGLLDTHSPS